MLWKLPLRRDKHVTWKLYLPVSISRLMNRPDKCHDFGDSGYQTRFSSKVSVSYDIITLKLFKICRCASLPGISNSICENLYSVLSLTTISTGEKSLTYVVFFVFFRAKISDALKTLTYHGRCFSTRIYLSTWLSNYTHRALKSSSGSSSFP